MHGTIYVIGEMEECIEEEKIFEVMKCEWSGIDYVEGNLTKEVSEGRIKGLERDANYPEVHKKTITVTKSSKLARKQLRDCKILKLADQIVSRGCGESELMLLLKGEPYLEYVCYAEEYPYPCVVTLDSFLRKGKEGIYKITKVLDYHY